jgi:hypothetical protein
MDIVLAADGRRGFALFASLQGLRGGCIVMGSNDIVVPPLSCLPSFY